MLKFNFKVSLAQEYLLADVDFRLRGTNPDFSLLGLRHVFFFSDLSYNQLDQLPPKALFGNYRLQEL